MLPGVVTRFCDKSLTFDLGEIITNLEFLPCTSIPESYSITSGRLQEVVMVESDDISADPKDGMLLFEILPARTRILPNCRLATEYPDRLRGQRGYVKHPSVHQSKKT